MAAKLWMTYLVCLSHLKEGKLASVPSPITICVKVIVSLLGVGLHGHQTKVNSIASVYN